MSAFRRRLMGLPTHLRLLIILVAGLTTRLALTPLGNPADQDAQHLYRWSGYLITLPLREFYGTPQPNDHLPGDLLILALVGWVHSLIAGGRAETVDALFFVLLKLVSATADVGIGLMLFLIGRLLWGNTLGLVAAALYMFNPASIFLTSVWGQWDPISSFLALAALWLLLRGSVEWSFPVLVYAVLIKPFFAALAPIFVLFALHQYVLPHTPWSGRAGVPAAPESLHRTAGRAAIAIGASVVVAIAVLAPFGVTVRPLPGQWGLFYRLSYSWDIYQLATANAFNIWALANLSGGGRYAENTWPFQSDLRPFLLGQTYATWGTGLLLSAYGWVLLRFLRAPSRDLVIWACLATCLAIFMLPTRVHERYVFPAAVLATLMALIRGHWWIYAALSLTFLTNLVWAYLGWAYSGRWSLSQEALTPLLDLLYSSDFVVRVASLINIAVLIYVLFRMPGILSLGSQAAASEQPRRTHRLGWVRAAESGTASAARLRGT